MLLPDFHCSQQVLQFFRSLVHFPTLRLGLHLFAGGFGRRFVILDQRIDFGLQPHLLIPAHRLRRGFLDQGQIGNLLGLEQRLDAGVAALGFAQIFGDAAGTGNSTGMDFRDSGAYSG